MNCPEDLVTVTRWSGQEAAALRLALRRSVLDFAHHLGVAPRTIANWEARGSTLIPTVSCQAILDTALEQATTSERARFVSLGKGTTPLIVVGSSTTVPEHMREASCLLPVDAASRSQAGR
ncbi:hypothetical protein [Kineosporia sp. NBRC 101731]|uniref:hypothetical protein n=1 Tax=Kineosporia sp. NBRC 101731 TaxID=3032199 RepID=UPI0024A1AA99|nr:hypothetical protein [Kineosporia sp. NBRC 101731]GLY33447.1 hypothetical protein Kisp02_68120 [Kineosporia sp. NBRC 101731]